MDDDKIREIEMEKRIHREARKYGLRWLARHMFLIILTLFGLFVIFVEADSIRDYFRILTLAMGAFIVLFAARVIQLNWRIMKHTHGQMKMLPRHIQYIAISYIIFVIGAHGLIIELVGRPFRWYATPLIFPADLFGIYALGLVWRFQEVKRKAAGL